MNRSKLLTGNFLIYGLGTVLSRGVALIMLPIATRMMPSPYYLGINDTLVVFVSFVTPIMLIGMYDAMFRMYFEYSDAQAQERKSVCSTALGNMLMSSAIVFVLLLALSPLITSALFADPALRVFVIFGIAEAVISSTATIIQTPTRIQNQRGRFIAISAIISVITYLVVYLLLHRKIYLWAFPVGVLTGQILNLFIYFCLNHKWFSLKLWSLKQSKELLKIGVPLFPTFIFFWVFSSFDRIMITRMLGPEQLGIFAVGNRLATISVLVTTAFSGGWSHFQFSTMKREDSVKVFTKIIDYLIAITAVAFLMLLPVAKPVFQVLFGDDYVDAHAVFPYLFIAPITSMIFQLMGSQFLVLKKTYYSTVIAASGVLVNIALNYLLISAMGITGAGVATVASYVFICVIGYMVLGKKNMIGFNAKGIFLIVAAIASGVCFLYIDETAIFVTAFAAVFVYFLLFYAKDLIGLAKRVLSRGSK